MAGDSMFRLLTLGVLSIQLVKAQTGISPIPPEQLYESFINLEVLNCLSKGGPVDKCMAKSEFHTDYSCRYDRTVRSRCYCCGANYKYIEHGNICTRFCLKSRPSDPQFGQYPVITLPFNWGDGGRPESATLDDGADYPIIPVNARLSRRVYGFESYEDNVSRNWKNLGNDLSGALPTFTKFMFLQLARGEKDRNIVFSPISLHSVLTLLFVGSETNSQTRIELGDALGLTRNPSILEDQYRSLTNFMTKQSELLYNSEIFISSAMEANAEYAQNVFNNFGTNISYFLQDHSENSVKTINDIIARQTNGKIKSVIDQIDDQTKMLIINTILFDGKWAVPFEASNEKITFHTSNGKQEVATMKVSTEGIVIQNFKLGPARNPVKFEMIKIPQKNQNANNSNYEMRIIMGPEQFREDGLEVLLDLMNKFDSSNIFMDNDGIEKYGEVSLRMPKFTIKSKFEVTQFLKDIGVENLFTADAQLTKIADGPDQLSVDRILQEVVIKVDETGTEAAAATLVQISVYSAIEEVVREVNRPFVFILWDKVNSIPIIVGMINDPTLSN